LKRFGKNHGGYFGETIDVHALLRETELAAQQHQWATHVFHASDDFKWLSFFRPATRPGPPAARIYISAGIHGDEPAGPLAALKLLRENRWPDNVELVLLPCLNPPGMVANRRENTGGIDLNRDYRNSRSAEIRAHVTWLEKQPPFDLYICLHEDWESHGFYLYEQNPDEKPSLAEIIMAAVGQVCPIDPSEIIEDRPAQNGIIRPKISVLERPDWPEAFYLIHYKSRQGYTLEAPSDFPLETRTDALAAAVTAAVNFMGANGTK
jgi:predicted deacylase